jgi:peptidoglycan/xylan/chitin deacetylase (PgdA/CDA1 family)
MQSYTLINHYRIIEVLAQEKTAKTFLVENINTSPPRRLILKQFFPLELTQENYKVIKEKFIQEVSILITLGENNVQIPKIYEYFETDQTFCFTQEWIEGESLSSLIEKEGVFSEGKVKEIFSRIVPVLNYIHSQGVIHGNLNPDNIIFEESTGLPVLIDFAGVKTTMGIKVDPQGQKFNSLIPNSKGYIPSEQMAGKITYSSDLYALGLTAIYLLTGNHPHSFPVNKLTEEILWKNKDIKLSLNFANILDKAIKLNLSDRYQNGKEIWHDLQAKVSSRQKLTYSPYQELFESNMKDKSPISFSPVAIATTIIALLVVGGLFYSNQISARNQALIEEKEKEISQVENPSENESLNNNLSQINPENSPDTQSQPYYSSEITTPKENLQENSPNASLEKNPPPETKPITTPTPTQPKTNQPYIDISWSNRENVATKMPEKSIALTFDDGPHPDYTPQVLDILKKYNIKATFFLVGKRVEARCDLVRRIVQEGHEIGNHTYTHPFLTKTSPQAQQTELEKTQQVLENCIGYRPRWFRAPYGDQSEATLKIAHDVGLNTALWTVDTEDWSVEATTQKITTAGLQSQGKDIILMHDSTEATVDFAHNFQHPKAAKTRSATVNALIPMIEQFQSQNMVFVTMSQAFPDAP